MPAVGKPCVPCLGPVGTLEMCMCLVPAESQASVKQAIETYKGI